MFFFFVVRTVLGLLLKGEKPWSLFGLSGGNVCFKVSGGKVGDRPSSATDPAASCAGVAIFTPDLVGFSEMFGGFAPFDLNQ